MHKGLVTLGVLVVAVLFAASTRYGCIHTIQEGYVGVYYRLGRLSTNVLDPGLHFTLPFITTMHEVQVTIQPDYVTNVPCGTNSGVSVIFPKIEVINQLDRRHVYETIKNYTVDYDKTLIFDKINHEMNQFCSKHSLQQVYIEEFDKLDEILTATLQQSLNEYAPGVTIRSIRLTKPTVPREVEEHYKKIVEYQTEMEKAKAQREKDMQAIETENAKSLAKLNLERKHKMAVLESEKQQNMAKLNAEQEQKIALLNATKLYEIALIEANRTKELAKINMETERKLLEINATISLNEQLHIKDMINQQNKLKIAQLEVAVDKMRREADMQLTHQANMNHAHYHNKLVDRNYVMMVLAQALANNTKIFYGSSLPSMLPLAGLFNLTHSIN